MARALFPEEESAIDYKVVEAYGSRRSRLNRNFLAGVFVLLLLVALGCSFIIARHVGTTIADAQRNSTVSAGVATVEVEVTTMENIDAPDGSIEKWKSYVRFQEKAPLEPIVPAKNIHHLVLPSHGNASLYVEIHPGKHCLSVLSREALTEDERGDTPWFKKCYGRLKRNLTATNEIYGIGLGALVEKCQQLPVIPVMQLRECWPDRSSATDSRPAR